MQKVNHTVAVWEVILVYLCVALTATNSNSTHKHMQDGSTYLTHVLSKFNVMHLNEVNVLELHSFQRLMNTVSNSGSTEVSWLPCSVLANLGGNNNLVSRQVLDCSAQ